MKAIDMLCPYCESSNVENKGVGDADDAEQFMEEVKCLDCEKRFTAEYTLTAIYKK